MKVVCIGGGNGASQVLSGLKRYTNDLTGVIAVTDSGRSTGKIRIAVDIPAPGDIRNALVTLSTADQELKDLFQYRFRSEKLTDLDGMAFGNLFIAALAQMTGSFEKAVNETARFLKVSGKVIPVTIYNTHLGAELADGTHVSEEVNVRGLHKGAIKRLYLKDGDVTANPECIASIKAADMVTLGPGSLFTTVLACLLANGLAEALATTHGKVIYIANTTTQPGQTDGYTIADHVDRIVEYAGEGTVDYVLVNTKRALESLIAHYHADGLEFLELDITQRRQIEAHGLKLAAADLIEESSGKRDLWQKQDSICHDPAKVAKALVEIVNPGGLAI